MRPNILYPLYASVDSLKGVGPQAFKRLKALDLKTVLDILFHLPHDLINRRQEPYLTTQIKVLEHIRPFSKKSPYKIVCAYEGGMLDIVFFNYKKDYLIESLPEGEVRFISGKVERFGSRLQMTHPDYITKERNLIPLDEPVYPLTQGITNKMMANYVRQSIQNLPKFPEWLSEETLNKYKWPSFDDSIKLLHYPKKADFSSNPAYMRLAYDELLAGQLALALVRQKIKKEAGFSMKPTGTLRNELIKKLPFRLTKAQEKALFEIDTDMSEPLRMIRLLQGDVGSGKTVVGLMAMLTALENKKQAVLMAPTDILIRQHAETLNRFCRGLNLNIVLLTGREKGKKRQEILEQIVSGKAQIVLGTHALFENDVVFKDLGLAIIDEQHRFGVEQRLALTRKGENTDILVMTATPIPRSLALTFYGDMDASKIDERPSNRQKVDTRVFSIQREQEIMEGIQKKVSEGNQVFWVCPLIEETEKSDLASVTKRFEILKNFFGDKVALIHGKMKGTEKDALMQDFLDKKISVLVATTVIEVGVDVPNATVMVIEQAERFGLAQLHQLRGRIGRGDKKSICLLIYNSFLSEVARKRLEIMRSTDDGFVIAEEDLRLRGAGDVLGVRQSGLQSFKVADLTSQYELLFVARAEAMEILKKDPFLTSERGQKLQLLLHLFNKTEEIQTLSAG